MSDGTITRPEGDLTTQLKRITKRIASTQHQLVHPDKYSKNGRWTAEQKANLEKRLAAEKAMREAIRAERSPADAAETKKETLDGGGTETKRESSPKSPQVKPDPRKKSAAKAKTTTARGRKAKAKTVAAGRKKSTTRSSRKS